MTIHLPKVKSPKELAQQLTEQQFEQKLVRAGLLTLRPEGEAGKTSLPRLEPVHIQGEALSETIIRERR